MSTKVQQLEQAWLMAEAIADQARHEALQADEAVKNQTTAVAGGTEVTVLLSTAEELHARHEQAERTASEAFDRLWQAQSTDKGQMHA
jgi:hypothetical protein